MGRLQGRLNLLPSCADRLQASYDRPLENGGVERKLERKVRSESLVENL